MQNVWIAFGLTLLAGMATGIGSVIAFMAGRTNYRFLAVATGFSAGVMLYLSFVEIFPKGLETLVEHYGNAWGPWIGTASFFGGVLLIGLVDHLIPSAENPHETRTEEETMPLHDSSMPISEFKSTGCARPAVEVSTIHHIDHPKLMRMGVFTALALGIHNFPEGLATFLAALQEPVLGVAIALAIALHNIPEGISVSVPIFYATGNRKRAFLYSVLSGLAEPLGAVVAYLAIRFFLGENAGVIQPQVMGMLFGGVAGIMVYISLDELLPTSRAYGKGHDSLYGLVAGMLVMALSLLLLE
ncbi:MAG: Zinc transporter ZupT [Syntrophus sp. PtaB.Bin001]|nr:MAG: Zinc transporter ZupT [Syntrophus sp. PtaB.Bin001]